MLAIRDEAIDCTTFTNDIARISSLYTTKQDFVEHRA